MTEENKYPTVGELFTKYSKARVIKPSNKQFIFQKSSAELGVSRQMEDWDVVESLIKKYDR